MRHKATRLLAAILLTAPVLPLAAAATSAPSATRVSTPATTTTQVPSTTTTTRPKLVVPERRSASATITHTTEAPAPRQTKVPRSQQPQGDSWTATFNRLKGQLPGYYVVADKGSWGATNLSSSTVYIARRTPLQYLDDVMHHEAIHVLQGRVYGGISNARAKLGPYGGIEAVADCGARMLGATWTHYVNGCTSQMNHAARAMLNGVPA